MTQSGFHGFGDGAAEFYVHLEAENSRAWWLSHKDVYDAQVRGPMEALIGVLQEHDGGRFGEGHVFRPNRDVRFSKDKSPYKTHQGGYCAPARGGAYYVHIDADGLAVGGGAYRMARDQLARYRAAVSDDVPGQGLARILTEVAAAGFEISGAQLATRPRGVPADHPRLDLLRRTSLYGMRYYGEPPWLSTPEVLDRIIADFEALEGLMAWLGQHVGRTTETMERIRTPQS